MFATNSIVTSLVLPRRNKVVRNRNRCRFDFGNAVVSIHRNLHQHFHVFGFSMTFGGKTCRFPAFFGKMLTLNRPVNTSKETMVSYPLIKMFVVRVDDDKLARTFVAENQVVNVASTSLQILL